MGKPEGCIDHGFHDFEPKGSEPSSSEHKHTWVYQTGGVFKCACGGIRLLGEPGEEPPLTPEEEEEAPPDRIHPADCVHEDGCQYLDPTCENACKVAADELTLMGQDLQAPPDEGPCECSERLLGDECPCPPACGCCKALPPPEAPEGEGAQCWHTEPDSPCDWNVCRQEPEPPPQPDRRPPYAVAYSVQGHLYEVALPGDASVRAVDGALVIQHALGPVAGICQVLPVVNGEST